MLPDYGNNNFANDKKKFHSRTLRIPIYCANVRFCYTTNVPNESSNVECATSE